MSDTVLVRYGAIPEVVRCRTNGSGRPARGTRVVVQTRRGVEIGTVLEWLETPATSPIEFAASPSADDGGTPPTNGSPRLPELPAVLREATGDDESLCAELQSECERAFDTWRRRIADWKLNLELIELEWTLDKDRLVLYVLNDRGPDCTSLALHAAAAGIGPVEVQPVGAEGLAELPASGGCGSGGCGSGSCGM